MLNIISRSIYQFNPTGPKKVVQNLILGLKKLKVPFVVNKSPLCTDITLIHDDISALAYLQKQFKENKINPNIFAHKTVLIGPNIAFDPAELERLIPGILTDEASVLKFTKLICPSEWVRDFWIHRGYKTDILIWPVGVDTEQFNPQNIRITPLIDSSTIKKDILVYTKGRDQADIESVVELLTEQGFTFTVLAYGKYTEKELIKHALTHSVGLIITSSESQGLALEELMALNIPLLVWNIETINQRTVQSNLFTQVTHPTSKNVGENECATSVPYFSSECGIIVKRIDEIIPALQNMVHAPKQFHPRAYIERNLSLTKQAQDLVSLHDSKNTSSTSEQSDTKNHMVCKNWRNRTWMLPILYTRYILKYLIWKLK